MTPHRARTRTRLAVPALAAALTLAVAGCAGPEAEPSASPTPTSAEPTGTPTPTASPSPTSEATTEVGVWFLVDSRAGLRLVRELRDVPQDDAVIAAVEAMVAGPDDPDYTTTWDPGTEVLGVTSADGTVTVDLSEEARSANVGSEGAARMIQQLVHTVTDAIGDETAGVVLTIEGQPAGELWGAVEWSGPVVRADPLDVRLLVQIDTPREGATTTSPVTVAGDANVFEANLLWSVLDASGAEVQKGFTTTAEGQTFAPYSFSVELEPGTWTIVITEDDPSDGAGGTPMSDSRTVVVEP